MPSLLPNRLQDAADLSTDDEDDEEGCDLSGRSGGRGAGKSSASAGVLISFDGELEALDQETADHANERKPGGITEEYGRTFGFPPVQLTASYPPETAVATLLFVFPHNRRE